MVRTTLSLSSKLLGGDVLDDVRRLLRIDAVGDDHVEADVVAVDRLEQQVVAVAAVAARRVEGHLEVVELGVEHVPVVEHRGEEVDARRAGRPRSSTPFVPNGLPLDRCARRPRSARWCAARRGRRRRRSDEHGARASARIMRGLLSARRSTSKSFMRLFEIERVDAVGAVARQDEELEALASPRPSSGRPCDPSRRPAARRCAAASSSPRRA